MSLKVVFSLLSVFVALGSLSKGQTLFATEFEELTPAAGFTTPWQALNTTTASAGIDADLLPALGQTAFLGFGRPSARTSTIFHPIPLECAQTQQLTFEALLGVQDSTNDRRDTFRLAFFSAAGQILASIEFRNDDSDFGIYIFDGSTTRDTGLAFVRNELASIDATISLESNQWQVQLDGVDLVDQNAAFTTRDLSQSSLGFVGAQWVLSAAFPANHGDNFLLLADLTLQAEPSGPPVATYSRDGLQFVEDKGFTYQIQSTPSLETAFSNLPEGTPTQPTGTRQFYRVQRDFAPAPSAP